MRPAAVASSTKVTLTHTEYVRLKTLGITGVIDSSIDPRILSSEYLFVNDIETVRKERLREYAIWYEGNGDKLKNYYTRNNAIDYNMDPLYNENKKSYFWCVASTEHDIKRTHSGHPRDITDTLVNIMSLPRLQSEKEIVNTNLKNILKENDFDNLLNQKARPMTLVEGWGAWKINWDKNLSDYPILLYYRANNVDFIYDSDRLRAIIYKDFFQDEKQQNYVLYETRRLGLYKDPAVLEKDPDHKGVVSLFIEKELYRINDTEYMEPVELNVLPQLRDIEPRVVISNFKHFLGYPNIFYYDVSEDYYGRSIFANKLDIFDDLDQCFSQDANAVRRSTVHEYFNSMYLETDAETGLPIQPDAFDRKYIKYAGVPSADGTGDNSPVQVVQPKIDFNQYSAKEQDLLIHAISGLMSPATLGLDIAKKDNAASEREKEKVTIFTRNNLLKIEENIMKHIGSDLLVAYELMNNDTITCKEYDLSVQYGEFANDSFESRLETVQTGWSGGLISDEMAVEMLYGTSISKEKKQKELEYIRETKEKAEQMPMDMGGFGDLGADNPHNRAKEKTKIDDLKEDLDLEK